MTMFTYKPEVRKSSITVPFIRRIYCRVVEPLPVLRFSSNSWFHQSLYPSDMDTRVRYLVMDTETLPCRDESARVSTHLSAARERFIARLAVPHPRTPDACVASHRNTVCQFGEHIHLHFSIFRTGLERRPL